MEKIIGRIRKMLAIADDNGATEGERDNALRMAHTLLVKHNLTMGSLEDTSEKRDVSGETFYGRPWARTLVKAVADMFFCEYVIMRSSDKRNMLNHMLIGKESNRATAMIMAKYLVDAIRRESAKKAREAGENTTWKRSFCTGAVERIRTRIQEMMAEAAKANEPTTGTALVLASVYKQEHEANKLWLSTNLKTRPGKAHSSKPVLGSAYQAGDSYGRTVSLNRQVGE